jgi:hypothetical protein
MLATSAVRATPRFADAVPRAPRPGRSWAGPGYCPHVRQDEWQLRAAQHADRARPWVAARLARRAVGRKHAIDDFLFDYYPFSPAKLSAWHPGFGVILEGPAADSYLSTPGYTRAGEGVTGDVTWLSSKLPRLEMAIRILSGTASRPPVTGCFGLHEWAMVYGLAQDQVRHEYLPLRVSPAAVTATVESVGLRCTHIDAFRFFTPEAVPLNALEPTRATQPDVEQPGCLHAAMDLYKMATWFSPLVSSDLMMDCFENAARARQLDMQASPYDVSGFGLAAIQVETPEGRREYAAAQRELMEATDPLRARLLADLVTLQFEAAQAGLQGASDRTW